MLYSSIMVPANASKPYESPNNVTNFQVSDNSFSMTTCVYKLHDKKLYNNKLDMLLQDLRLNEI